MPIYEYNCNACGNGFELLIRGENFNSICPSCGSDKTDKRFSVFGMKSSSSGGSVTAGSSCGGCSKGSCAGCGH